MKAATFPKIFLRCLLAWSCALGLASCGENKRHSAEKTLHKVGGANVRLEAATFYKQLFVAPTGTYFIPKENTWPAIFHQFSPLSVRAYADGFSLALVDERNAEEGLYIVPTGMDNHPREGRATRFQRIEDGIYWYWFSGKQN